MITQGMQHRGFSYVEIMQVCPTFNKETPQEWYWDKLEYLTEDNYDSSDIWQARQIVEKPNKLPIGLLYQNNQKPPFRETQTYVNWSDSLVSQTQTHSLSQLTTEFV
jgi:2-oxoglutarate ferredoxin oxidoreductase subunit beta